RVNRKRPLEEIAAVHAEQCGGQHPDHGEGGEPAAHVRRMGEHGAESVLPRLLQTINSVRSNSGARATAMTALGSVLSSTDRDGFAKLDASTAGPRLDPPIPHTTVRVRPSCRAASAKRTRSS